jgi:Ca2+-binding RTX toxin-like protein
MLLICSKLSFLKLIVSFVFSDTLLIFRDPTAVAPLAAGANPNNVNATSSPVRLGGISQTYSLTSGATPAAPQQVALSDSQNRLNIPSDATMAQAIGGGHIIEAVQGVNDFGMTIKVNMMNPTKPGEYYNGSVVDKTAIVAGNSAGDSITINQAAGGQGGDFAYYVHAGSGNDLIVGSFQADFIRGGAGNDTIYAYASNDLIRGGSGSDYIEGGSGNDTLFYTADQMDGSLDFFGDFFIGVDKISFDSAMVSSLDQISGLGTNTIVFANNTRLISLNTIISPDDIILI